MFYNRGVLPFLWVQKYSTFSNLATLPQRKPPLLRISTILFCFITLPFCVLGREKKVNFFLSSTTLPAFKQVQRADSLFRQGHYQVALPLYRAQVWQQQHVSARLLMRLAYAEHQQAHYAAELLYLNMALARQPRLSTWRQLAALAQRQRLIGYPTTWQQEARVQFLRYYYPVLQGLLTIAIVAAVGLLLRRRRTGRGTWLAYSLYLLAIGAYLYWLRPLSTSIVARPGVALMAGPSAGAVWLSTAAPGDRLPVLGRQDIWLRVRWQERTAYVRAVDTFVIE